MHWLLLRGWGREQRHWHDFPSDLRRALQPESIVLLDLAGAGTERERLPRPSVPWLARDVARRFQRLPSVRAVEPKPAAERQWGVIGLSLGGMVALELCWLLPHRFARAVIINASSRLSAPSSRLARSALAGLGKVLMAADALERETRLLELTSELPFAELRRHARRSVDSGCTERVRGSALLGQLCAAVRFVPPPPGSVSTALCFLGSQRDRLVNHRCSRDLALRYGAPYREHPWAGHDLPLDDPDWVCQQIAGCHLDVTRHLAV
ncbi:MAG TPA: alpha/beta hydrolase [Polyangiaceae bacterium]|nr:alpha/beta hydrolase [Polyangiaceae bacterium]